MNKPTRERERESNEVVCLNSKGGRNGINGLQPSLCNRIYHSENIATAVTTSQFFMPNYLVKRKL